MSFPLGCLVRVTGLAAAQHHNGKAATVCGDRHGRIIVLLDDGSQLAVKPINLRLAANAAFDVLSFTDRLTCRRVSLALVADGKLQSPQQLRAQFKCLLELIKANARIFTHRSPRWQHRRQQALPPIGSVFVEYAPWGRVLLIFPCVATACHRLVTAPAHMRMSNMRWSWAAAELVMERVTRGRVRKVQVRLQRRACCAVRCACRASSCVRGVFNACCRNRWLILRCVAAHRSGCIKRAAAFILVCRLLPPALQAQATFGSRQ
jgi:hypothetical protein